MSEEEKAKILELTKALEAWLAEHNARLDVVALLAPRGGQVAIENFVPDGWKPLISISPK